MRMAMQMELLPPSAAERALAAALERRQRARLTAWRRAQKEAAKGDGRGRHSNSLHARHEMGARITGRRAEVLAWLEAHSPATDRQIMLGLGYSDMNAVRPRITELLDAGRVREVARVRDEVTGMMVRQVAMEEQP